jgi:hypothetical protein
MKPFFPTSLALLLVMGSLGHVLAAAFCPRMLGHDCCLTKKSSQEPSSQSHQHMHGMAMDGTTDESMQMDSVDMQDMIRDDASVQPSPAGIDKVTLLSSSEELVPANRLELPIEACTHCMTHSGAQNAPISSVSVPDQSNKDIGSVPLPVSRFLIRPPMALAQIGLPREHAPPGSSAPRHILINVFLI